MKIKLLARPSQPSRCHTVPRRFCFLTYHEDEDNAGGGGGAAAAMADPIPIAYIKATGIPLALCQVRVRVTQRRSIVALGRSKGRQPHPSHKIRPVTQKAISEASFSILAALCSSFWGSLTLSYPPSAPIFPPKTRPSDNGSHPPPIITPGSQSRFATPPLLRRLLLMTLPLTAQSSRDSLATRCLRRPGQSHIMSGSPWPKVRAALISPKIHAAVCLFPIGLNSAP